MLIKGDVKSNKFNLLVEKYTELINSGVSTASILVILQTPNDKKRFIDAALSKININALEKLNIHTFHGLIYNTISDNWVKLENNIPAKKHFILPNLVGLEVSQLILKDILKDIQVKGYNSKKSLLHQIFRRYSLILQNNLTESEIIQKSEILKEAFAEDAHQIIKTLMSKTLSYRSFDYLRQMPLFKYIYQNTDYFKNIEYLIVDDADEMTPFAYAFFESLKLKDSFISFDSPGNSRAGYLSANPEFETHLYNIFKELPQTLKSDSNTDADKLYKNILNNEENLLDNLTYLSYSKRAEMFDHSIKKINELLKKGVKPRDISIVSPVIDDILKFSLSQNLTNVNLQFISGSEKLIDSPIIKSILNILKLGTNLPINEFDMRGILTDFLGIPMRKCKGKGLNRRIDDEKYTKLIEVVEYLKTNNLPLSDKIFYIYQSLVDYIAPEELKKFNFFLKQIQDFEKVFPENRTDDIITQIENSIISENPYSVLNVSDNDLIISTPQKIIDNKILTKYQIWLDVTSNEWTKSDIGPLYNSWVFQKSWTKSEYTIEDDISLAKEKTAKIIRKLALCTDYIFAYSSLFDSQGGVNDIGWNSVYPLGIKIAAEVNKETNVNNGYKIIPRDDQKPVLEYKRGAMAISAVPGAGKTTILLALILKLIEQKVQSENIYVLTYMESAARNFKDRIKNINPENTKLPNITTIHGLALRILKENSNFERLGLDADFDICDDSLKMRIISTISGSIDKNDIDDFTRAISVFKFNQGGGNYNLERDSHNGIHPKVKRFLKFFNDYQQKLAENNLLDYDDILVSAVRLLEENPDILEYYQNMCRYIIEDEAQDSSAIQQRLLNLLAGKYRNIIRCGDINQAITTTFTNADVEGFYNFINNSDKVMMDRSQRCTEDVYKLANKLVQYGAKAFYNMMMRPVIGKNPVQKNAVINQIFETGQDEKNFVLSEIKTILAKSPDSTIGILLRNNYQVAEWESFINNAGFKVITRTESLGKKAIFKTIFAILKAIENPFSNKNLADTYQVLREQGVYNKNLAEKIKDCETDFITINPDDAGDLSEFLWDMNYWLMNATLPFQELVSKIGLCYYKTELEISNVYLISILVARLNVKNDLSLLIEKLNELAKRPSLSGFKFFCEEDSAVEQTGKIQIMTLHKSKGDEFDYVFIPELTERNLPLDIQKISLKSSSTFMENVKALNPDYKKKTDLELKEFNVAENFRLLYVAITRAKKKLFITVSKKSKAFGRMQNNEVSMIFGELL